MLIECLPCAGLLCRHLGYSRRQKEVPALKEFIFWGGGADIKQTDRFYSFVQEIATDFLLCVKDCSRNLFAFKNLPSRIVFFFFFLKKGISLLLL